MASAPVVHVVDDDESFRLSIGRLLRAAGYAFKTYVSGEEFLTALPTGPGCVVLDVNMEGASGFDVQDALRRTGCALPIVFLTGHGDIPASVRAIRAGAEDFLTKPARPPEFLAAIARAIDRDTTQRIEAERLDVLRARYRTLTEAEQRIFALVVSGRLNKQIAYELGRAERTVKAHRRQVMTKLQADSVADLVRIATDLGIQSPPRQD